MAPVAFAGAGIARSDPWKTGWAAFQLGMAGFIIPLMFVYAPELLFVGGFRRIPSALVTAVFGVYILAAAVRKCLPIHTKRHEALLPLKDPEGTAMVMTPSGRTS